MHISSIIEHFPYFGVFVTLVLGGLGFPFPEGATLIVCGFIISTHVIRLLPALSVAYSGVLIGDLLAYYFGRKYGRMIVTHKKFQRILSPQRLLKLEDMFKKRKTLLVIVGGHLIGEIFIVAGILKLPFTKFLLADAIASVFIIAIWVSIGYISGNSLDIIRRDITRIEHMAILLVTILLTIFLIFKRLKPTKS